MHKLITLILCLVVSTLAGAQRTYESVAGDPMDVRIYTLSNGLRVYLSRNTAEPRIAAYIAVNTGHKNDPAETTGLAHYLEHLMFKGTKHFGTINYEAERPHLERIRQLYEEYRTLSDPIERKAKYHQIDSVSQVAAQYNIPNEYDKLMASIGGLESNAYTWYDVTCYTEVIPSNELDNWARIQSDRFQNMVIRGFHTELESVYEEKNISLSDDGEKQYNAFMQKLFPTHSYGTQTTLGTQEHLKNPSIINIEQYFNRYYKPNNLAMCIVGDIDYEKTIDCIERHFGQWQPGNDIAHRTFPQQPVYTSPVDTTVVGLEEESVMLGWRFNGAANQQCDTLLLLGNVLFNGNAGLLDLDINQRMEMQQAMAVPFMLKEYSTLVLNGVPREGQSLDEVRSLLLSEVEKVKQGKFDEDLLQSIVSNLKLQFNQQIETNEGRVDMLVDAYINGVKWQDKLSRIERISHISKLSLMDFARRHLTDGYVCVYKAQGEDTTIHKIEKPAITPIPTNRDLHSAFLTEITGTEVQPIQPRFVDLKRDLSQCTTRRQLPLLYKHNTDNELFSLTYHYDFGSEADNRYAPAAEYFRLVGTKRLTSEDISKEFYRLACRYDIAVGEDEIDITISGLSENTGKAVALFENILHNAVADAAVYSMYVEQELKDRTERRKEQSACFKRLLEYGLHGARNCYTNRMTAQQLRDCNPVTLLRLLSNMSSMQHTLLYYGPLAQAEVCAIADKYHKTPKRLALVPQNHHYEWVPTTQSEIIIAPYEAKNIYLNAVSNEMRLWSPDEAALDMMFNEYFSGGMNSIVFQELREARGLAYSASAQYVKPSRAGQPKYLSEYIISQNDKMMDCINCFADITNHMPQSEAAFQLAKQSIIKNLSSVRINRALVLKAFLNAQKHGLDYDIYEKVFSQLPSLTLADVVDFERTCMAGKPLRYLILGDEKELDMDSLSKIAPIRRITLDEIFEK